MGETCGMKLVYAAHRLTTKCKICEKIDTKQRRRQQESERVARWHREGGKFAASIEKSIEIMKDLDREIYQLSMERVRRGQSIGSGH